MKWSTKPPAGPTKRYHVKVKPLKLEGFCKETVGDETQKNVVVEMEWNRPKSLSIPFYRSSSKKGHRNSSTERLLTRGGESIEWYDEFESICDFSIVSKDGSFGPWLISFTVSFGESVESKSKMTVLGKASLNLSEVAAKMESEVERRLPLNSKVDGVAGKATLLVSVSFAEFRSSQESSGLVQNSNESDKGDSFFKKMLGLTGYKKKKMGHKNQWTNSSSYESDESAVVDSDGYAGKESTITNDSSNTERSSGTELESPSSSETQVVDPVKKDGLLSRKRRGLSFRRSKTKVEPSVQTNGDKLVNDYVETDVDNQNITSSSVNPITSGTVQNGDATEISSDNENHNWELKELVSRDGQTKLKANVFFASFDQRSEKVAGAGACTTVVAVIAHWLHTNRDFMPTTQEYNKLIAQGSSDWRMLCSNEAYANFFPNKHFDLETVLEAGLYPITVSPDKSFTGFFSPEKFESLKGAMSFDEIWNEINNHFEEFLPRIYIVSWNDHFFVLKAEGNAHYIIDSLGERLFEGCNQAYIIKFDDSSLMYGKAKKEVMGSEEKTEEVQANCKDESEEMICRGKECCKEYIKRFLAAVPLGELEVEEKKGTVSKLYLHQRLQIDFHYSSSSSSATSSSSCSPATSSNFSPFSSEEPN